jgi:hypothetical protein
MSSGAELSARIPQQIADKQNVDPTELTPRLYDVIDLDALEHAISTVDTSRQSTPATFTFQYDDLSITVEATADVDITVEQTSTHRTETLKSTAAD